MPRTKGSKNKAAGTSDSYNAYVKELEDKVARLEAMEVEGKEVDEIVISQTEYIKVMSLIPYRLNLCTKERGQGKVYKFDTLYQVKRIIYSDLVDILEVCREFLEQGYFVILNPRVVRAHGLDEIYERILTKERIETIFTNTDEGVALYAAASKGQQDTINDMVLQKLVEDPKSLDLNLVDKIARISGRKFIEKADDMRELLKAPAEPRA
jgi:hypothetical protein